MKTSTRFLTGILLFLVAALLSSYKKEVRESKKPRFDFPYEQAGLSKQQAAAHLLSRFTYGAEPGQIEAIGKMGLEKWFLAQMKSKEPDDSLNALLTDYEAIGMTNAEIAAKYPRGAYIKRQAIQEGYINKDSVDVGDRKAYRDQIQSYMAQKGWKPEQDLYRQLINQKILRATYSNNQLQEILTSFWFNHFNVSIVKNDCAQFILPYERDAIRPNSLGRFEDLLMATAKSPAMLLYLDNFNSIAPTANPKQQASNMEMAMDMMGNADSAQKVQIVQALKKKNNSGINENYAREIMELHTLGVDGGYTQSDVTQAARVLTGWTLYPFGEYGAAGALRKAIDRIGEDKLAEKGYVHEGDFLFAINRHDKGEKTVLGTKFPAGGGYEEGVQLIHLLSHHPNTAKFICRKLAVRFVNDNPPQSLVDKMSKVFLEKDGDIAEVMVTMVSAPEFWSKEALREKVKSPFELAISSVRSLNADVTMPYPLFTWITKMGEKMYYYQAPTGFPDRGQYWINTGSLLSRMNFGLALASQKIPGVRFNLMSLNQNHEPESAKAALVTYSKLLMPDRDLNTTVQRLTPLLTSPDLEKKVSAAASQHQPTSAMTDTAMLAQATPDKPVPVKVNPAKSNPKANNAMLAQVVGIIIGSPEYQRK